MLSDAVANILICPACRTSLRRTVGRTECPRCSVDYTTADGTRLDLRPRKTIRQPVEFEIGTPLLPEEGFSFGPLAPNPDPEITNYRDIPISAHLRGGNRLNHELLSYFPRAEVGSGGVMLDLGCGFKEFEEVCRHTNLEYIGMDYSGDAPDMLGDAHALPFRDNSIDFVMSLAVLEHLRFPFVAMSEVFRVLKPGGLFIGTVAFLEPFHMDSYAHLTHLGTYNVLKTAGFDVRIVAPNNEWSALNALASMILYPRLPQRLATALVWPNWLLHKLWWKLGHAIDPKERTSEAYRLPATTGGFRFVVRRPLVAANEQLQQRHEAVIPARFVPDDALNARI